MTKKQIQNKVLKDGEKLALSEFSWDEKINTFSSLEDGLVIDFSDIDECTITAGDYSSVTAGDYSSVTAGDYSIVTAGYYSSVKTGYSSIVKAGYYSSVTAGCSSIVKAGDYSSVTAGDYSSVKTGDWSSVTAGYSSIVKAGCSSIVTAGDYSVIGVYKHAYIYNEHKGCALMVTSDSPKMYNLDELPKDRFLMIDSEFVIDRPIVETKIIDERIMTVDSAKQINDDLTVYQTQYIKDYFEQTNVKQFVAESSDLFAHGATIKQAVKDLEFKVLQSKNVSEHVARIKKSGIVTPYDYRLLTGACEYGVNEFLNRKNLTWEVELSIEDAKKAVQGEYGCNKFIELLER